VAKLTSDVLCLVDLGIRALCPRALHKTEAQPLQRLLRVGRVQAPEVVDKAAAEEVEAEGRRTPLHPVPRT
jgi:hypothetical protein